MGSSAGGMIYRTSGGKNGGEAAELWAREFGDHRGEALTLADGTAVEVGQSFRDEGFYVEEGKVRTRNGHRATAGYYFVLALDALDFGRVEHDPESSTVFVEGSDGVLSAYDYGERAAADERGSDDLTHGMATALLYGEYERARVALNSGAHDVLQLQYLEVFEAYRSGRTLANLIRATDGNYAALKGQDLELTFGDTALTVKAAEVAAARRGGGEPVSSAGGALLVDLDPASGFTVEHEKLARVAGLRAFAGGAELAEADWAFAPAPDPAFVLTDAAALVAEEIAFSRSIGNKSYQVMGEPGAGKNYLLRQMSAVEGRPHLEIDAGGDTDVNELFGAPSLKNGSMEYATGKVTAALEKGFRIVLNEANAADPELLTVLHNVVGSGNGVEDRVVVIPSPESERTVVPVHEDADFVVTFNPEGTASARRLPRALSSRMPLRLMEAPSAEDAARVVAAQANRMLGRRDPAPGALRVDDALALAAWEFYREIRACATDTASSRGFERAPDARWVHRFAAEQAVRGARALRLAEELYDHDSESLEDARVARETVRDLYSRRYGGFARGAAGSSSERAA